MNSNTPHYSMVIEWFDDESIYVVSPPEWGELARTHGNIYAEAVKNGKEVLEMLVEHYQAEGRPLPRPKVRAS